MASDSGAHQTAPEVFQNVFKDLLLISNQVRWEITYYWTLTPKK